MFWKNRTKNKKKPGGFGGWYSVTLRQFNQIKNLDLTDFDNQITAAGILLGMDVDNLSWKEFSKVCAEQLDFLDKEIPVEIVRTEYTINGRKYICKSNLNDLSVARYMDFTNLAPTGELEKILSVILIPEGKEYGEDIEQTQEDILDMSIVDVYAIYNFFQMQFKVCLKTLKDFSVGKLKGMPHQKEISSIMDSLILSDQQ